jgi:hypothetical protein
LKLKEAEQRAGQAEQRAGQAEQRACQAEQQVKIERQARHELEQQIAQFKAQLAELQQAPKNP